MSQDTDSDADTMIDDERMDEDDKVLIPITLDVTGEAVNDTCRTHGTTRATPFQAAWVAILRAFTDKHDVISDYITNRELPIPGIEQLVSPMINMLACRLAISETDTAVQLLKKTHDSFLEVLEHQHGFENAAN